MQLEVNEHNQWTVLSMFERVDAFHFDDVKSQMSTVMESGQLWVAIDLSRSRFISLPLIKYISAMAKNLEHKGGGLALLGISEKIKRQIDIYASLDSISLYRNIEDWRREQAKQQLDC